MAIGALVWKLASPYDAYVNHVVRLNEAVERIKYFTDLALGYEAGLQSSVRLQPGVPDSGARVQRFREQLGDAAAKMSDEEFEEFIAHLGGGSAAEVETDRAKAVSRLGSMTRGLEEYFAMAGHELALLEQRGYSPKRGDVARQLRDNRLPPDSVQEYRHLLHELGKKVGKKAG